MRKEDYNMMNIKVARTDWVKRKRQKNTEDKGPVSQIDHDKAEEGEMKKIKYRYGQGQSGQKDKDPLHRALQRTAVSHLYLLCVKKISSFSGPSNQEKLQDIEPILTA